VGGERGAGCGTIGNFSQKKPKKGLSLLREAEGKGKRKCSADSEGERGEEKKGESSQTPGRIHL